MISRRTEKILWGKAAGRCSFPSCQRELIAEPSEVDGAVVLGEVAHIIARSEEGPRGRENRPADVDDESNLILLCEAHHKLVDGQRSTYSAERLRRFKADHEAWVRERISPGERLHGMHDTDRSVRETLYGTFFNVLNMPGLVFSAPCASSVQDVASYLAEQPRSDVVRPFVMRDGRLIAFTDLRSDPHLGRFVDSKLVAVEHAAEWVGDQVKLRWFVELLNRSLHKLTGRKGINFDRDHQRYYFEMIEPGEPRSVRYRSLQGRSIERQVVWKPKLKFLGGTRNHWEHLAVGLRFHRVGERSWLLSIRPERRFTIDGVTPVEPRGTGKRATKRKSRMYNIDVLTEVNFWRDFLSDGQPRFTWTFGQQALAISTEPMNELVVWPGVPDDARPFTAARYEEDLFSLSEYDLLLESERELEGEFG